MFAIRVRYWVFLVPYGLCLFPRTVYNKVSTMPFSGPTTPNICKLMTIAQWSAKDSCLRLKASTAFPRVSSFSSGSIPAAHFLKFRDPAFMFQVPAHKGCPVGHEKLHLHWVNLEKRILFQKKKRLLILLFL